MAVEVGMGYVSIVPEVQGFAGELQRQVAGPAESAGQEGGQAAGESFTGKMGGVLKGGLAAIGLAAAAVLTKGFMDALDQGAINGKIQAQLGSTPEDAARYGKAAGQLYAGGVTDSVEEAADAISGVMRSGILPPDATNAQIESIAGKVTDLSKTFELDLGQTSNAVGQMLKNGLAKDGTEALDILTAGMQKMGPRADDMADTFNEYSTKFRDLGLSAKDAMGLMSQGMQAGARDTDTVADALKEFQIRATDGSKSSAAAYEAIGLSAEDMTRKIAKGGPGAREGLQQVLDGIKAIKDPAERNAAAVGLFGTKAEDLGQALFALDPKTAVKALGDTAGAAGKMGDALHDNAGARVEQFKRGLEVGLTNAMGDYVIPALTRGAGFLKTVFTPALEAAGRVVGPIISEIGGGFRAFGAAFKAGGDDITSSGFAGVLESIGLKARGLFDVFQTSLLPALSGLWAVIGGQLLPAFWQLYTAVAGAIFPVFQQIGAILIEVVWPAIMRVYAAILENLQPVFSALSEFITSRVVPAAQMIGEKLRELFEKARPIIEVLSTIVQWFGVLAAKIVGFVVPILINLAGPIFSLLFAAIGTAIGWIGNIIGFLGDLGRAFLGAVRATAEFTVKSVQKVGEFLDWMKGLPGAIGRALGDFGRLLYDKGGDLVRGLWEGVKALGGWLKDKLLGWAKNVIPGPIAKALGINSPSRLMRDEIGRWIPPGIVEGIDSEQSTLDARLQSMVTVPDIGSVRAAGSVGVPRVNSAQDTALADVLRALEGERDRDIVVRVGEQEIARAVANGQRQLARR
ncbi:phage tail tape measure protein [Streptomyces sp. NPDC006692]|uniref:phage tail tape measure protein n=1 Tax=Streptomyces sp. NPDC006692 TaxID=3364758 RepID=UPI0036AF7525